jgi:hypothetical protein
MFALVIDDVTQLTKRFVGFCRSGSGQGGGYLHSGASSNYPRVAAQRKDNLNFAQKPGSNLKSAS